jgi:hypothetical protein
VNQRTRGQPEHADVLGVTGLLVVGVPVPHRIGVQDDDGHGVGLSPVHDGGTFT